MGRGILLTRNVLEAINKARELFEIEDFLCCVSRVIHRYMRSEGIAGMIGRGSANLYRPIVPRTAGGSCV